ncbi:MAG: hypothetical protein KY055_01945 [Candidatus Nealsonbacteria bacterium]|nr:hypothetical protein [Candidatus Nealsonbacteria bacterium]
MKIEKRLISSASPTRAERRGGDEGEALSDYPSVAKGGDEGKPEGANFID